jgi:hypothetical protein
MLRSMHILAHMCHTHTFLFVGIAKVNLSVGATTALSEPDSQLRISDVPLQGIYRSYAIAVQKRS